MDLTPSTPAARVIDEVVQPGHGVHERQPMMNNMGIHPFMYGIDDDEDGAIAYVEGQRTSPLALDFAIAALGVLLGYMILRRFL